MSAYVKTTLITVWLLASYIFGQVGRAVGDTQIQINWANVGWAFLGATSYMLYEMIKKVPVPRSGLHRGALIFIGMTVSMAGTNWIMGKMGLPIEVVATGLGFLGYVLLPGLEAAAKKPGEWYSKITKPTETP